MSEYFYKEACDTTSLSRAINEAFGYWSGSVTSGFEGTRIVFQGRQLNAEEQSLLSKLVEENLATEELKKRWKAADDSLKIRCRNRAALYYLECLDFEEIELEPGLVIRPATQAEKSRWPDSVCYNHVLDHTFDLEQEDVPDHASEREQEAKELMNKVVLALLLFNPGRVKMEMMASGTARQDKDDDKGPILMPRKLSFRYEEKYVLRAEEIEPFKQFWTNLRSIEISPHVLVAGKRLISSNSGVHFENRILDCIAALECLLIRYKERNKGPNLRERVAILLGGSPRWKELIMKDLNLAYAIRNDIVHDGEPSTEHMSQLRAFPSMFCDFLEDYIRRSIKAYMLLVQKGFCRDKNDFINKLLARALDSELNELLNGIRWV